MKNMISVAALLALTLPFSLAQTPPGATRIAIAKEELRRLSGELNEAVRTHDQAALKRIFANDYVYPALSWAVSGT